jgi:cation diffusion facilitator family transporter
VKFLSVFGLTVMCVLYGSGALLVRELVRADCRLSGGRPVDAARLPAYGSPTMKERSLSRAERFAIWMGIAGNAVLFGGKIVIGLAFNSIAIISDSLNSFTDIIASTIVFVSIRASYRQADQDHPFGHHRAQPIAGLIVAIFTGIVGFEVITQSVTRLFTGESVQRGLLPILLVAGVMVVKLGMHLVARSVAQRARSTALMASAADHRNDVLVSAAVLAGVVASNLGWPIFDPIVAILIGLWIIRAGFAIGRDNIKFLMGEVPPKELLDRILAKARAVEGVFALNDVFAHYVGTTVEIEVHINVDRRIDIEKAHAIGKQVQWAIEGMEEISRAFIHIDPLEV